MEFRCENCGALIEEISDPNPALETDDPPDYDRLCPKCRSLLEEHAEE